jgi:hypothetical protein
MSKTTIISGFLTDINNNKSIDKYIYCGKKLLEINEIPKIIFIEKNIYDTYFINNTYSNCEFIFFEKKDMYYYCYLDNLEKYNSINPIYLPNPNKNTIKYFMVQCYKTEWMKIAINKNCFSTDQFIWLDFGIYHIFEKNKELFNLTIYSLIGKKYDKIRIANGYLLINILQKNKVNMCNDNIWYFFEDDLKNRNIYDDVIWFFLGGIFGGSSDSLLFFADKMKEKCLYQIQNKNRLTWEVNLWYSIYYDNPELFDCFTAEHDPSMIANY